MKQEQAIGIAQDALLWLTSRPEDLQQFLNASGASAADLRAGAGQPEFLGFLLDFLLQSDALVLAFAQDTGVTPGLPARARAALPSGDQPDWT